MQSLARLRSVFAAACLALAAPAPLAAAPVDWLLLLVDASASIDTREYDLQRDAYVDVLRDPKIVTLLRGAKVAIVEFARNPLVVVDWTGDPLAAADTYAGHRRVVEGPGPGSTTGIARALALGQRMLEGKPGRRVIDISGDGPDNVDFVGQVWSQRERARRTGIEINGLAIPTPDEPEVDHYYADNVITGFLEISQEHLDFERSLWLKMSLEIVGLDAADHDG